ncbi:DUF4255 domain-containing protein [Ruania alba]|uniref:Pvc16 N-terminal domain-containing protein n=1 Tax=Ruania alba TaxID=648782 RepID=A0A1H5KMH2_9MICO|nr:DUF4255 domain-containing protein [Ruania alba]SEE66002.1 Protein of unknown function [Ruania alba]
MLISAVEDGIENLLRAALPLDRQHGDISFEAPNSTWSTTVNRLTVNLFLYGVSRSAQPPMVQPDRRDATGRVARRFALPMVELSFLVSAWAGSARDEHELLSDVLTRSLTYSTIPAEHLNVSLDSTVQLAVANDEKNRPRDVWSGLGGSLKASFVLIATVAADAYPWQEAAPVVDRVTPAVRPKPERP